MWIFPAWKFWLRIGTYVFQHGPGSGQASPISGENIAAGKEIGNVSIYRGLFDGN